MKNISQENGPEVGLRIYGDEFCARNEAEGRYTVIHDEGLGKFTYALLKDGSFVSSGVDISPPNIGDIKVAPAGRKAVLHNRRAGLRIIWSRHTFLFSSEYLGYLYRGPKYRQWFCSSLAETHEMWYKTVWQESNRIRVHTGL